MTATVRCNECGSIVEVSRETNNALTLRCDCPDVSMRPIRVANVLPERWSQ